ncbi:MAG: hypothetical protein COA94_02035, partial [Rickettsiales bacterium]
PEKAVVPEQPTPAEPESSDVSLPVGDDASSDPSVGQPNMQHDESKHDDIVDSKNDDIVDVTKPSTSEFSETPQPRLRPAQPSVASEPEEGTEISDLPQPWEEEGALAELKSNPQDGSGSNDDAEVEAEPAIIPGFSPPDGKTPGGEEIAILPEEVREGAALDTGGAIPQPPEVFDKEILDGARELSDLMPEVKNSPEREPAVAEEEAEIDVSSEDASTQDIHTRALKYFDNDHAIKRRIRNLETRARVLKYLDISDSWEELEVYLDEAIDDLEEIGDYLEELDNPSERSQTILDKLEKFQGDLEATYEAFREEHSSLNPNEIFSDELKRLNHLKTKHLSQNEMDALTSAIEHVTEAQSAYSDLEQYIQNLNEEHQKSADEISQALQLTEQESSLHMLATEDKIELTGEALKRTTQEAVEVFEIMQLAMDRFNAVMERDESNIAELTERLALRKQKFPLHQKAGAESRERAIDAKHEMMRELEAAKAAQAPRETGSEARKQARKNAALGNEEWRGQREEHAEALEKRIREAREPREASREIGKVNESPNLSSEALKKQRSEAHAEVRAKIDRRAQELDGETQERNQIEEFLKMQSGLQHLETKKLIEEGKANIGTYQQEDEAYELAARNREEAIEQKSPPIPEPLNFPESPPPDRSAPLNINHDRFASQMEELKQRRDVARGLDEARADLSELSSPQGESGAREIPEDLHNNYEQLDELITKSEQLSIPNKYDAYTMYGQNVPKDRLEEIREATVAQIDQRMTAIEDIQRTLDNAQNAEFQEEHTAPKIQLSAAAPEETKSPAFRESGALSSSEAPQALAHSANADHTEKVIGRVTVKVRASLEAVRHLEPVTVASPSRGRGSGAEQGAQQSK